MQKIKENYRRIKSANTEIQSNPKLFHAMKYYDDSRTMSDDDDNVDLDSDVSKIFEHEIFFPSSLFGLGHCEHMRKKYGEKIIKKNISTYFQDCDDASGDGSLKRQSNNPYYSQV